MKTAALLSALLLLPSSARAQETDLDRALLAADRDTSQRIGFYSELVSALLYVPAPSARPAGADPGALRFSVADTASTPYVAAFDRADRLRSWAGGDVPHRAVAGSSVVSAMATDHPGVPLKLNPGTRFERTLAPKELAWLHRSLNAPQESARVAGDTEIYIGGPAFVVPDGLLDALLAYLRAQRDVREAHLSQFNMTGGQSGLLLTLSLDQEVPSRLAAIRTGVGAAVLDVLPENVLLGVGLHSLRGVTENARETGRRIYTRAAAQ